MTSFTIPRTYHGHSGPNCGHNLKTTRKRELSILYGSLFYWQLARQEVPSEELDLVFCSFDASVLILLSEIIENKPNLTLFLSWRKCDVIWGCHSQHSRTGMELIGVSALFRSKVSIRSICLKISSLSRGCLGFLQNPGDNSAKDLVACWNWEMAVAWDRDYTWTASSCWLSQKNSFAQWGTLWDEATKRLSRVVLVKERV